MSNATLIQVHVRTPVMDFLTGCEGDAQLTFFRSESACYATFATHWVRLNFQATALPAGASDLPTTADVPRAGDMLCHTYLVINAPAIVNVTDDFIDVNGERADAADGTHCKRMFVQTGDGERHLSSLVYDVAINDTDADTRITATVTGKLLAAIIDTSSVVQLQDSTGKVVYSTVHSVVETGGNTVIHLTAIGSDVAFDLAAAGKIMIQGGNDTYYSATDTAKFLDIRYQHALTAVRQRTAGPTGAVGVTATGLRPNIPVLDRNNIHANYGTYAPCTLVNFIECVIGESTVSKVTGLVMQAHCELWMSSDRLSRRAVNKSSDPTERGAWALNRQTWVVPVPFWFTQGYHSSLPLCALSFHTITFNLYMNPYTRAVVNGCGGEFSGSVITVTGADGSTTLKTVVGPSSIQAGSSSIDLMDTAAAPAAPSTVLSGSSFTFYMLLELIYIGDQERNTYQDLSDEVLVLQFQYVHQQTLTSGKATEMQLRFNHPVSHLVIAGQLQSNLNDNRYGDYEGPSNMFTISRKYPEGMRSHWLKTAQLHFNNNARTLEMPWWFFHEVMPQVSAERIPDSHFYLYSFGLGSPNGSGQFHGGADFSRLDSAILTITPNPHVFSNSSAVGGLDGTDILAGSDSITGGEQVVVSCFAVSANVAKFENGLMGICFL
jgi:hypothetical protein